MLDYPEIVDILAERQKLPGAKVRSILRDLIEITADGLRNGKAVRIGGLGVLRIRDKRAGIAAATEGGGQKTPRRVVFASAKKFKSATELE
jgi:nucleoid DNA-binding protein